MFADERFNRSTGELPRSPKVRDGQDVDPGGFADVASLHAGDAEDAPSVCSGTLIAPDAILTALHCVCLNGLKVARFGNSRNDPAVRRVALKAHAPSQQDCRALFDRFQLPSASPYVADLAVLRLVRTVEGVAAREFASDDVASAARAYAIVGFGDTVDPARPPGVKRETLVGRLSLDCVGAVTGSSPPVRDADAYGCTPARETVAGRMPNEARKADTCRGDSGGPLLAAAVMPEFGDPPKAELRLAGVTSRPTFPWRSPQDASREECGDGGVYVRLTAVDRAWISAELSATRGDPQ